MPNYDDKDLLELFADEQQKEYAFELIVDKYSRKLYWIVRKMVVCHDDANDIVQDVLIKLWNELPKFRGDSSIYTWAYRIAINQAISAIRSRSRSRYAIVDTPVEEFDRIIEADSLFDGDALEKELERAIQTLPDKQRAVFLLRYYDEVPFKEIAEILDTSEGALKASYHIARQKIESLIKLSLDPDV